MKKSVQLLMLLVLTLVFSSQAFAFFGNKSKTTVLRLSDNQPEGYPTVMASRDFAKYVEEGTDGRVKIEVYAGAQLGDEVTMLEQLQFGAVEMMRVGLAPLSQYDERLNILMLPFIYQDSEHMFKVLDGPIGDEFLTYLADLNLIGLGWLDAGERAFYNTKRPIKSLDDMKGLKFRVMQSQIMLDIVSSLGGSPTPMPYGDVYSSLQTGVIDGAENNWPSFESSSHYEVAKYFTVNGHTRVPELFLINKNALAKLDPKDQQVIRDAGQRAAMNERRYWKEREDESRKKIVANGNIIDELTPEARQSFQDAVKPLYKKYAGDHMETVEKILQTK